MKDYDETRRRHLADAMSLAPRLMEQLDWSQDRLQAHRTAQLRELLDVAVVRSPWHRRRLRHVRADTLNETTLQALPVMTKDDLVEHFQEIVVDGRLHSDIVESHLEGLTQDAYLFDHYHAIASGGSSGRRGIFVYDWQGWALSYVGLMRHEWRAQSLDRVSGPVVMAVVSACKASHGSKAIFQTFSSPRRSMHSFPVSLPINDIVTGLNRLQPTVLSGYPSVLHSLTHQASAGQLVIAPQRVITYAEPLLPEIRGALEQTWGAPVCNWWCSSEAFGTAISCGRSRGLHLNDDLIIVEPVDERGCPVAVGERSAKVYLTNLFNHALPLIRYEISDEITVLDERCSCGCAHRLISDVEGRLDDGFDYSGVAVHPHIFRSPLGRQRNIVEYQVRQTLRGAEIRVSTVGPLSVSALEAEIGTELRRLGVPSPEVSITISDRLERPATGKLKRFIPISAVEARALSLNAGR